MVKEVSTREFLRNYVTLRESLKRGEFDEIQIVERNGYVLRVVGEAQKSPFEVLLEDVKAHPLSGLTRPEEDLF